MAIIRTDGTHYYDLVDGPGAAPDAPANSATLTQLFSPHGSY
ncbi:MAG TPA: hypothetical protein VGJ51_18345 [Candidatus Angelobacter sp.]